MECLIDVGREESHSIDNIVIDFFLDDDFFLYDIGIFRVLKIFFEHVVLADGYTLLGSEIIKDIIVLVKFNNGQMGCYSFGFILGGLHIPNEVPFGGVFG